MTTAATDHTAAPGDGAPSRLPRRKETSRPSIRLTSRGIGMLTAGIVLAISGVGFATTVLVYVGVATGIAVVVGWSWVLLTVQRLSRSRASAHRQVTPLPLTAGVPGTVSVTISSHERGRGAWLRRPAINRVDLREQAAAELTGGANTRASVERKPGSLTLTYGIQPSARGRWSLGPTLVHSSDPLGLVVADNPVGQAQKIPVWPPITEVPGPSGALMGHATRVVLGARTPSEDDASLRDYREGDDLRRVHWPSSARRGTMLVRSDERAGRRPVTVLLDAPVDPAGLERAISVAASIAVSVLSTGHPVRLVGAGIDSDVMSHVEERRGDTARVELLNQTVDVVPSASRAAASADLVRAARLVADDARDGEAIVAIIEPLDDAARAAVAPLGETGHAWAIVRTEPNLEKQSSDTVTALLQAGWRVTTAKVDDDIEKLWIRLMSAGNLG